MNIQIKNRFTHFLPADKEESNYTRQVLGACYSFVAPVKPSNPQMIHASRESAKILGLDSEDLQSDLFLSICTGRKLPADSRPYAMCYGGHQFGQWAGQLGDGRAINLGEIVHKGKSNTLQLKGVGKTPYSRSADGMAVLRSSIREYLCSEAMHHLGVPTTRALSVALSGDQVMRDMLYDGNPEYEKGAVVARVAPSFLRFGSYEIFAARKDLSNLKTLADYTIQHHFPHIKTTDQAGYLQFFEEVVKHSLDLVINWQRVGFVHGVLNTDNMSILGLTIDYGPYGWLEGYDPNWTPNTTDSTSRRYRFGQQGAVVQWNLYQLANALFPLIGDANAMEAILKSYPAKYRAQYLNMMRSKLGLEKIEKGDQELLDLLEQTLVKTETDMSIFFRKLGEFETENSPNIFELIEAALYNPSEFKGPIEQSWIIWFERYAERLNLEERSDQERQQQMNTVNPKYVLRNYMAQLAIDAADKGDYSLTAELSELLKKPYEEQESKSKWFAKRPEWARNKIGCSMLSCSS